MGASVREVQVLLKYLRLLELRAFIGQHRLTIWVVRQQTSGLSQPPDRQRHAATCTTEICVPELSAQLTNLQHALSATTSGAARVTRWVVGRAQRRCNALKCLLEPADFKYEAQQLAT